MDWKAFGIGFAAGLAASPHCLGMCGGFPLHLAKSTGSGSVLLRQVLFVLGKSFTYVFLGALAATAGIVLMKNTSLASAAPALRIAVGVLIILFGLAMLGVRLPRMYLFENAAKVGFVRSAFGSILHRPGPAASLVLGLGVGFLPCPLPMAMLAVAAGSHDITLGMLTMAGVGLGTAPALLAVGLFGAGISRRFANAGMRIAGVFVVAVGLLTIGRASGIIPHAHGASEAIPSCCEHAQQ